MKLVELALPVQQYFVAGPTIADFLSHFPKLHVLRFLAKDCV